MQSSIGNHRRPKVKAVIGHGKLAQILTLKVRNTNKIEQKQNSFCYLGVDTDSISTTSKTTTTTSTSVKTTKEVEKPPVVASTNAPTAAVRSPSTFKIDAHTAKWLNYKVDKPSGTPHHHTST